MSNDNTIEPDVAGHRFSGGLTGPETTEDDVEGHRHAFMEPAPADEDDVEGHARRV